MAGTRWVGRQVLDEAPGLDVAVYAIWFEMVATDSRARWPEGLLDDPRVRHFWDEERVVGRWFGRHADYGDDPELVIWDTYFLYGPEAEWGPEGPTDLRSWGYTIVETRDRLKRDLLALAGGGPAR